MANAASPRSVLKSSNSPRRNFHSVSFQDPNTSDSRISFSTLGTPISNWSLRSSPHSKTGGSDHSSSADGLSIEEITCLDVDDILPKTDYTYARTASYSPKFLRKKRYISPNMSRCRIDGPMSSFLTDDEDDFEKEPDNEVVITRSDDAHNKDYMDKLGVEMNPARLSRSRKHRKIITSSPMPPHELQHISAHDHYYEGMLLRSGSHIKGSRRGLRALSSNSNSSDAISVNSSPVLAPTYRSDLENTESHRRRSGRLVTTVTTTTTDTSFDDEDEEDNYNNNAANLHLGGKSMEGFQLNSETYQKSAQDFDDSEWKLQLDETETEKIKGRGHIRLQHLQGLDYGDDISDVDDVGSSYGYKQNSAYQNTSTVSRISSFFIMIVTTITTTITESSKQIVSPVATAAVTTVTSPVRWMWRALISTCSWILWNSSSLLLLDIEVKQRRKRGCCCCLLPLLLFLPLALLAGYYVDPVKEKAGNYLLASESAISSYWARFWTQPAPVFVPPVKESESNVNYQIDMTQFDQHIHQTIVQVLNQQQQEQPQGLTADQVEAIVKAILASKLDVTQKKFDSDISSLNDLLIQDMANVRSQLSSLEKEIKESGQSSKVIAGDLNAAKVSFESLGEEQRAEWLKVAVALEEKLLDMRNEVNEVTNRNIALAAMLKSCCQNNSMIMAAVHSHMADFFSKMDKDKDSAALAGLMGLFGNRFVDRDEMDEKLAAAAAEITVKMREALVKQAEEIHASQASTSHVSHESVVALSGNLDEIAVRSIVEDALLKFSADGIGMPDFALESSGGSILNIRCSETFYRKTALVSVLGLPLWYTSNSPRTVIQPSVHPGECWAFQGSSGYLVIQLSQPIQPTGFTLEHIPRTLSPNGNIDSAPRAFSVYGLTATDDLKGVSLGNYTYSDTGRPIQHFPVQNQHPGVFQYVELKILSNYGNVEYTCLYRFRVHGLP